MRRRDFLRAGLIGASAAGLRLLADEEVRFGAVRLPPGVTRIPSPQDAATVAMLDCGSLSRDEQIGQFYLWDNIDSREARACLSWTVNAVMSQTPLICRPRIISNSGVRLLAWNLYDLCPKPADFSKLWHALQEVARFEPYFHQPSLKKFQKKTIYRTVPPYIASDGKTYDYTAEVVIDKRPFEFGIHANAGALNLLSDMTGGSLMPIARGDWFLCTALTSLDSVDGIHGRYYQLAGLDKLNLDGLLKKIGANPKLPEEFRQKAVQISDVTGLWRTSQTEPIISGQLEGGPGTLTITNDIKDSNEDEESHALLNLIGNVVNAKEIIFSKPNGLDGWYLTNGDGVQQAEAPPDVAAWPDAPWKRKHLPAGISCIDCHAGGQGLNPLKNVVLTNDRRGFSPLFDLHSRGGKMANKETQEIIRAQYLGDVEAGLVPRRLAYSAKVDQATLGVFRPKLGEADAVVLRASKALVGIYREYFAHMNAQKVLREVGYECPADIAPAVLRRMIPIQNDDDARIRTLLNEEEILRADFHKIFPEVCNRDAFRERP